MILKVHASNFKMIGFTEMASLSQLSSIAARHAFPLVEDCGSGYLLPDGVGGLAGEPSPRRSLAEGCDLVLFSGDKLLGGPQAGIIAGKSRWIERIRTNPLMRILRLDKMNIAALEATLKLYDRNSRSPQIPVLQMIERKTAFLKRKALRLYRDLVSVALPGWHFEAVPLKSLVGGGSCPGDFLESYGLRVFCREGSVNTIEKKLREFQPPIIARKEEESILMDVRTLLPGEECHIRRFFSTIPPG